MTTTAHEDQFTAGTQTIQPVLQPYSTEAILRRNIADAEKEMQRQAERAESYADALRSLAAYVGAGGYNADTVDAGVFEDKIRWGIGEIMARMEKAEAELAKIREQKPVAWMREDGNLYLAWQKDLCLPEVRFSPLYAAPITTPHKGATHCDDCGLTWLDDGLNPLGCPYCKDTVPAPAHSRGEEVMNNNLEELKRLAEAVLKAYSGLSWQVTMARNEHGVTHYHIRSHSEPGIAVIKDQYWEDDHIPPVDHYGYIQPDDRMDCDVFRVDTARLIAAANPAAILALIAEIDSLRDQVNGLTGELGLERKRLDWAVSRESFYDHTTRVFFCDRAFKIPKPQVRIETDNFRATIDELMEKAT